MEKIAVTGSLPEIISNRKGVYEGNLEHYFWWIFFNAKNLGRPYHNFRHLFRVVWACYQACVYYGKRLTPREKRDILIATMFHDVDHLGNAGNDGKNIKRAIKALKKAIAPEDEARLDYIGYIIRMSEFPHKIESKALPLLARILRDADVVQALDPAWIQEVVFGLAKERGMEPIEVLREQIGFLAKLEFGSEWAEQMFPEEAINDKMNEARELLDILEVRNSDDEGETV